MPPGSNPEDDVSSGAARANNTERSQTAQSIEAQDYPAIPHTNPYVKPIGMILATAVAGVLTVYGFTITFPASAHSAAQPAPAAVSVTPVEQPKVRLLSESDVQLVAEHAAKRAADEVLDRVERRRKEDADHIDQRLDALTTLITTQANRPRR